MSSDAVEIARAWRTAVERNDMDTFRTLYAPDAVIWTSIERAERPLIEHLDLVAQVRAACDGWVYEDVRCQATETGFVQQHTVRMDSGGAQRTTVAAVIGAVADGRITRLDEYFNRTVELLTARPPRTPANDQEPS